MEYFGINQKPHFGDVPGAVYLGDWNCLASNGHCEFWFMPGAERPIGIGRPGLNGKVPWYPVEKHNLRDCAKAEGGYRARAMGLAK